MQIQSENKNHKDFMKDLTLKGTSRTTKEIKTNNLNFAKFKITKNLLQILKKVSRTNSTNNSS